MSKIRVILYQNEDESVPLLEWLDRLPQKAVDKCIIKIELLAEFGHGLRRPHCDFLEEGIYELRARLSHVNYRILYFFAGASVVVVSHGCTKEDQVARKEINRAMKHRANYIRDPKAHTYRGALQ